MASTTVQLAVFAVYALVFVLVLIALVFYLNRFIAWTLTKILNVYIWRKYKARIEFDSIRISILGGNILLKHVRYACKDYIVRIEGTVITFRYWLTSIRDIGRENLTSTKQSRVGLSMTGVEWFIFNRTEAYKALSKISRKRREENHNENQDQDQGGSDQLSPETSKRRENEKKKRRGKLKRKSKKEKDEIKKDEKKNKKSNSDGSPWIKKERKKSEIAIEIPMSIRDDSSFRSSGYVPVPQTENDRRKSFKTSFSHDQLFSLKMMDAKGKDLERRIVDDDINNTEEEFDEDNGLFESSDYEDDDEDDSENDSEDDSHSNSLNPALDNKSKSSETISETPRQSQSSTLSANQILNTNIPSYLPLDIQIEKGAILIGNPGLVTILSLDFELADGVYTAENTDTDVDGYLSITDIQFLKARVSLLSNYDFQEKRRFRPEPYLRKKGNERQSDHEKKKNATFAHLKTFLTDLKINFEEFGTEIKDWPETTRSDQEQNLYEEYARVEKIFEVKRLQFNYLVDVVGKVPMDDTRFDLPTPIWDLSLQFGSTSINYGPWADRQRSLLQTFFYPFSYEEYSVTEPPRPGHLRPFSEFKLKVEFTEDVVWRIPLREKSKDHLFGGPTGGGIKWSSRKYAWMDFKFSRGSTLNFNLPVKVTPEGYTPSLSFELKSLQISTSLTYSLLASADTFQFESQFQIPRLWNQKQTWDFDLNLSSPKVYLLREHIPLFLDLVDDFSSGPPTPFAYFIPTIYNYKISVTDLDLYLNVNEGNIIGKSDNLEENVFIILNVKEGSIKIETPFLSYQPPSRSVPFKVEAQKPSVLMSLPESHTVGAYLDSKPECITASSVTLDGYYFYFLTPDTSKLDTLSLQLDISKATVNAYGFFLHYIAFLKRNYISPDINFTTLEEYRLATDGDERKSSRHSNSQVPNPEKPQKSKHEREFSDQDEFNKKPGKKEHSNSMSMEFIPKTKEKGNDSKDKLRNSKNLSNKLTQDFSNLQSENDSQPNQKNHIVTPFEFTLLLFAKEGVVYLPKEMNTLDGSMILHFQQLDLDVRYLPIFTDISLNITPIVLSSKMATEACRQEISLVRHVSKRRPEKRIKPNRIFSEPAKRMNNPFEHGTSPPRGMNTDSESTQKEPSSTFNRSDARVVIDEFSLTTHFMYGPAPLELTYNGSVNILVGNITGNLTPIDLVSLSEFISLFPFHIQNVDNRMKNLNVSYPTPDLDYTSVDIVVKPIHIGLISGPDFLQQNHQNFPSSGQGQQQQQSQQFGSSNENLQQNTLPKGKKRVVTIPSLQGKRIPNISLETSKTESNSNLNFNSSSSTSSSSKNLSTLILSLPHGLNVSFSNLINKNYHSKTIITLPLISMSILLPSKSEFQTEKTIDYFEGKWVEIASGEFSFDVVLITKFSDWEKDSQAQLKFIREQDSETFRCSSFYEEKSSTKKSSSKSKTKFQSPILQGKFFFFFLFFLKNLEIIKLFCLFKFKISMRFLVHQVMI